VQGRAGSYRPGQPSDARLRQRCLLLLTGAIGRRELSPATSSTSANIDSSPATVGDLTVQPAKSVLRESFLRDINFSGFKSQSFSIVLRTVRSESDY
jgi:hypothetical protein